MVNHHLLGFQSLVNWLITLRAIGYRTIMGDNTQINMQNESKNYQGSEQTQGLHAWIGWSGPLTLLMVAVYGTCYLSDGTS